ncbi:MAG TPA: type II toxin-antitoxin system prevent-host-death family antitoxin [Terriglobia bacterium]|nr:type II toxin-antitoxin system prevent-host-death family antitoxin [Terriglobia bacterium]
MARGTVAYNMYEAKTKLSQLVDEAISGKQVILMNRGEPVAMVVPIPKTRRPRKLGFLKGKLKLKRGWDSPIPDFKDYQ